MIYFKSKYLAEKLSINLAKWKRWTREFLDPDPLGGYQSGFARQFSFKEAFRVFLGGHLVGELNFAIPQARQILIDLHPWLKKNRVYAWPMPNHTPPETLRRVIYIFELDRGNGYGYAVRSIARQATIRDDGLHQEVYSLELMGLSQERLTAEGFTHGRLVDVDALHSYFLNRVDGG